MRYYNYVLQVISIQWNAGMGNTDTLHPNSCFCSFSIPTSKINFFVTTFYAHAHETTPTSVYKLSHTHVIVVPIVPSPCFLRQSATVAKVRETFLCLVCPYLLRDRRVVVGGRVGHGLVLSRMCFAYNCQDKRNTSVSYLSLSAS